MPLKQQQLVLDMAKRRKRTPKKRGLRAVNNIDDKEGRLAALILLKKSEKKLAIAIAEKKLAIAEKKLAIAENEKKLAENEKKLAIAENETKLAIAENEKSRIHERLLQRRSTNCPRHRREICATSLPRATKGTPDKGQLRVHACFGGSGKESRRRTLVYISLYIYAGVRGEKRPRCTLRGSEGLERFVRGCARVSLVWSGRSPYQLPQ